MAFRDTFVIPCNRYLMDDESKTAEFVDTVNFFVPYSSISSISTSLYIIYYGLITDYYDTLLEQIPSLSLITNLAFFNGNIYPDYPNAAALDKFPNLKPLDVGDTDMTLYSVLLENKLNNRVFRQRTSTSSDVRRSIIYLNLNDALNDRNVVYSVSSTRFFFCEPNSGSGGTRGQINGFYYIDSDYDSNNDTLIGIHGSSFQGARSTTNSFRANGNGVSSDNNNVFLNWIANGGVEPIIPPTPGGDDPYSGGGTSVPADQDDHAQATFDFTSTDIPVPATPSVSASDTGFLTLYHPSSSQLKSLAAYMWSSSFDIDNFRKLFANPMDAILGCHIIPTTASHPATSSAIPLTVGNIATTVSMPPCTEQYYELDCQTIQIQPKWGAYLDYSPYSKLSLYLPYIGIMDISPDDCMGGSIQVKYKVDILSGSCIAFVYCTSNKGQDSHVLYVFNGDCHCPVPVTEGQYGNFFIETFKGIANSAKAGLSASSGDVSGFAEGVGGAAKTIQNMIKPDISRSGSIGGSAGLMGIQYPFLILTVPRMCIPGDQNVYIGYPSFVTMTMGDLTGYTEVEVSHLNNMPCTQEEAEEIISLLESGVIF